MLFCKTVVCPENFSVFAKSLCNFKLETQEGTLLKLLNPTLNKNIYAVPLYTYFLYKKAVYKKLEAGAP